MVKYLGICIHEGIYEESVIHYSSRASLLRHNNQEYLLKATLVSLVISWFTSIVRCCVQIIISVLINTCVLNWTKDYTLFILMLLPSDRFYLIRVIKTLSFKCFCERKSKTPMFVGLSSMLSQDSSWYLRKHNRHIGKHIKKTF